MARIKLVYLGGGSTRAAGTMASFMHHGADFDGSEVVLVDLDPERLRAEWWHVDGVLEPTPGEHRAAAFEVPRGASELRRQR